MKTHIQISMYFFILFFTILTAKVSAQVNIQEKNCTCYGSEDGNIKILNLSDSAEVRLDKIVDGDAVQFSKFERKNEFKDLAPGAYKVISRFKGIETPYPAVKILEPPILDFSFESLLLEDLPRSASGTGRLKIKYNAEYKNIRVFYKLDGDGEYKSLEGKPEMTIADLKPGNYQIFIENSKTKCTSGHKPTRLNVLEMFQISKKQVGRCQAIKEDIEFDVVNVFDQNITVTYKYNTKDQGLLPSIGFSGNSTDGSMTYKYKLKPQGLGDYEFYASGSTPERTRTLQVSIENAECVLRAVIATNIYPNYSNDYLGSFTVALSDVPSGLFYYKVTRGTELIKEEKEYKSSSFTIEKVPPGSYSIEFGSLDDKSAFRGSHSLAIEQVPDKKEIITAYVENWQLPFYRKLVSCEGHIKRVDGWVIGTSIFTALGTAAIPLLNGGFAITTAVVMSAGTVGITAANLKGDKYKNVVAYEAKLKEFMTPLGKIDALFLTGSWNSEIYKQYMDYIKEYEPMKSELDKAYPNPGCSLNRQSNLLLKQYPKALDPTQREILIERSKKPSLEEMDQESGKK